MSWPPSFSNYSPLLPGIVLRFNIIDNGFIQASMAERRGCAPALTREITVVSDLFPLFYSRFRATLAEAIRHAGGVGERRLTRGGNASVSPAEPVWLGN